VHPAAGLALGHRSVAAASGAAMSGLGRWCGRRAHRASHLGHRGGVLLPRRRLGARLRAAACRGWPRSRRWRSSTARASAAGPCAQIGLVQPKAHACAIEVMATSRLPDAREGMPRSSQQAGRPRGTVVASCGLAGRDRSRSRLWARRRAGHRGRGTLAGRRLGSLALAGTRSSALV